MVGCCAPSYDAITGRKIEATMTNEALICVAKGVGMTMHQYMKANPDIVFVVEYGWVTVTYNKYPNGSCGYELTP